MATLGRADMLQRVAESLKIRATGQGIRPRDTETIYNALDDTLAMLAQDEVGDFDSEAIPQYIAIPLALLVAAASAHGCNVAEPDSHIARADGAKAEIRRLHWERHAFDNDDKAEVYF